MFLVKNARIRGDFRLKLQIGDAAPFEAVCPADCVDGTELGVSGRGDSENRARRIGELKSAEMDELPISSDNPAKT
jgi:hypothetical protein